VCRCPQESGALFLYRKIEKVPEPVLLAAPPVKVTDEEAEEFIKTFNETLDSVDPETIAKAAAPAEGEEVAGESIILQNHALNDCALLAFQHEARHLWAHRAS